jgi:hypothetical protein
MQAWGRRYLSLRSFLCTASLTAILIGALRALAPMEHALFPGMALSDSPFPNLMLILGLPHIVIGFLYSATSKRRASARGRLALAAAGLIGVALACAFHRAGGPSGGWRMILVSLYFLVHTYRDEFHFYRRSRNDVPGPDSLCTALLAIGFYAGLAAAAWTIYVFTGAAAHDLRHTADPRLLARSSRAALWLLPCLLFAAIAVLSVRSAVRRGQASLHRLLLRDSPLWCVYLSIPALCFLAVPFGGKLYAIVLLHVVGWWTFATHTQAAGDAPSAPHLAGLWRWMRTTQKGFQLLHGAMVAGLAVLMLYFIHAPDHLGGTGLDRILTPGAFYYWTIVHVTMSFAPQDRLTRI